MYKCKTHEVEDIFFDDETWFKVVTKDWIKIWIDLSDIALVWRLEWSLKQRVLWEITEKLSWRDKRKLIAVHLNKREERRRLQGTSRTERSARRLNIGLTGAQENIAASALTMKPQALCDLLNERLDNYKQNYGKI